MNRANLKARRDEAIKTGKVYSSVINEGKPFNEATDWTYRDFRDATQILINRLTQLLQETDTDNPGQKEAKLMRDVSNIAKVWSDKVVKVFWNDEKVKNIEDPEMPDEPAISNQFKLDLDRALFDRDYQDIKFKEGKNQSVVVSFKGNTKHGWILDTLLDIFRFNGKLVVNMKCFDAINKDAKLEQTQQSSNMNLVIDGENVYTVIDKVDQFYEMFEEIYGVPEGELMTANASLEQPRYRMPIDEEVLNVVSNSNIELFI